MTPSTTTTIIPAQRDTADPAATWGLVERARAGDLEALSDLYRCYGAKVEGFIRRRTNGDMHLAEDIAAEAWIRAIRSIGAIEWRGRDVGVWLITIARNLVLDHYKSRRSHEIPMADMSDVDTRTVDDVEAIALSRVANRESIAALRSALTRLTRGQREVIELRFFRGLDIAETARRMGRDDGAVKGLQLRALRAMARQMNVEVAR